jgi:molecular chaperone GrpE
MSEENSENLEQTSEAKETAETKQSPAQMELETAKAEALKFKNDFLYLRAEFDNYKKSVIKERADVLKYGAERVFVELLEVVDNFERALESEITKENFEAVLKGIKLIHGEIKSVLNRFGVQELPALGQKFDPNIHNALSTEPTTKVPSGHVSQVFKKPYKLHDRVIRPGHVVIAVEPKSDENNG